jgi:HK97 gp10 family phage protein
MREISFDMLIEKFLSVPEGVHLATKTALTKSAVEVHKTATKKFGHYQGAIGPYNAWAVLNPEYVQQKLKAGSKGDDPLIGHSLYSNKVYPTPLRQALTMDVQLTYAKVGTNDPIGEWQEFGTSRIPTRPFLRPALFQNEAKIKEIFSEQVALGMHSVFR